MGTPRMLNRRTLLAATAGTLAVPALTGAQSANTLRITGWGGRWGEIMRQDIIPVFEKARLFLKIGPSQIAVAPRPWM